MLVSGVKVQLGVLFVVLCGSVSGVASITPQQAKDLRAQILKSAKTATTAVQNVQRQADEIIKLKKEVDDLKQINDQLKGLTVDVAKLQDPNSDASNEPAALIKTGNDALNMINESLRSLDNMRQTLNIREDKPNVVGQAVEANVTAFTQEMAQLRQDLGMPDADAQALINALKQQVTDLTNDFNDLSDQFVLLGNAAGSPEIAEAMKIMGAAGVPDDQIKALGQCVADMASKGVDAGKIVEALKSCKEKIVDEGKNPDDVINAIKNFK